MTDRVTKVCVLLLASLAAAAAFAQTIPIGSKIGFEKALEQKAENVLNNLFGANRVHVSVDATLDFSSIEKMSVNEQKQAADTQKTFLWQDDTPDSDNLQILPGFPAVAKTSRETAKPVVENKSYERQISFPASFIKKITATVVVDNLMTDAETADVRNIVTSVLGIDRDRGDSVSIIRANFIPSWKKELYSSRNMSLLFRYGILTLLGILAMLVMWLSFLKLAGALNSMTKAQDFSHKITMDLAKRSGEPDGLLGGGEGGGQLPGGKPKALLERQEAAGGGDEGSAEELLFDVKPNQVATLVILVEKEDPSNIALVANHLRPDIRKALFDKLPSDVRVKVLENMGSVRYVGADAIAELKTELEKRLNGMVGGIDRVMEVIEDLSVKAKSEMVAMLEKTNPQLAAQVRQRILLFEDVWRFSDKDFGIIVMSVRLEDWASVLRDGRPEWKAKVAAGLPAKSVQLMDQLMKFSTPTQEKIEEASEKIVETVASLIKEGRVIRPAAAKGPTAPPPPAAGSKLIGQAPPAAPKV